MSGYGNSLEDENKNKKKRQTREASPIRANSSASTEEHLGSSPPKRQRTPNLSPSKILSSAVSSVSLSSTSFRQAINFDSIIHADLADKEKLPGIQSDSCQVLLNKIKDINEKIIEAGKQHKNSKATNNNYRIRELKTSQNSLRVRLGDYIVEIINKLESSISLKSLCNEMLALSDDDIKSLASFKCFNHILSAKQYDYARLLRLISRVSASFDTEKQSIHEFFGIKSLKDSALEAVFLQLEFEKFMQTLGLNYTPLVNLNASGLRSRINLICGNQVICGFNQMQNFLKKQSNANFTNNKDVLKQAGLTKILSGISDQERTYFEIAWDLIMNDGKRRSYEETHIFATSFDALGMALDHCSSDSTLVVNGHGGAVKLTICDENTLGNKHLNTIMSLINERITHVILSSCTSGLLTKQISHNTLHMAKYPNVEPTSHIYLYKNRRKLYVESSESAIDKLFEPLLDTSDSIAKLFARSVLYRSIQDETRGTAFTFSPSLIFPDEISGLMGAPLSESRVNWPDYVKSWDKDERLKYGKTHEQIAWKSITLYNNHRNKKALFKNDSNELVWSHKESSTHTLKPSTS